MDIQRVKFNLGRQVLFCGKPYRMTACVMRPGSTGFHFQAELKDAKAESSLVIADLKEVEEEK
jgi:hypothetical protein